MNIGEIRIFTFAKHKVVGSKPIIRSIQKLFNIKYLVVFSRPATQAIPGRLQVAYNRDINIWNPLWSNNVTIGSILTSARFEDRARVRAVLNEG